MKCYSSVAASLAIVVAFALPTQTLGQTRVTVTANSPVATWEGWGTSLCWWANVFGDRDDIADAFFTLKNSVNVQGGPSNLPGLGMTIARYNIGASSHNSVTINGKAETMRPSSNMPAYRFMESFWLDGVSSNPNSSSWNWNADAKQRTMLFKARQRGATQFEAFSNSPPWWMTNNLASAGGNNGGDNLQTSKVEQFAIYLATVVQHFKDNWGLTFQYVEPFNEPSGTWWGFPCKQEGCHVTRNVQAQILPLLRQHLNSRGLQNVAISASDESTVFDAVNTLSTLASSSNVLSTFTRVNTHGYAASATQAYTGPYRGKLRDMARQYNKKLWLSEYGEKDTIGLVMAESIARDINEMATPAFVYWQVLDGLGWGLITSSPNDKTMQSVVQSKYFVLAQYSRHIRPGMQTIRTSDVKTVAAYDAGRKVLVLVAMNTGTASQTFTFDLSAYASVGSTASLWTTETSANGKRYAPSSATVAGKTFSTSVPAKAVQTIEIANVSV